jgi:hypothetical protein
MSRLPTPPLEFPLAPIPIMLALFAIGVTWIVKQGKRNAQFQPEWGRQLEPHEAPPQGRFMP